jgi:hypothetical protein
MSDNRTSSVANYGGSVANTTQSVKCFITGPPANLAIWKNAKYNSLPSGAISNLPLNTTLLTPAVSKTYNNINIPVYIQTDLYVNGTINGTLVTPSDENLKDNIHSISELKIKEFINLDPKEFTYKSDPLKKHYGFMAQDVEKIYPELVNNSENGYKTINYIEIIPLLVAKINEMQKQIDAILHISHL